MGATDGGMNLLRGDEMKILVACEYSGTVRDAFTVKGHDATSCDILPTETDGKHYQGDVRNIINDDWDMIITFPPCTDLAVSGARWFKEKQADGRQQASIDFFMLFANSDCPKISIENPVGIMSTKWRKPDQIVQPWMFGDDANKKTCLWLKGLPLLEPTKTAEFKKYRCKCGHVFGVALGKYGCPNCCGEHIAVPLWSNQTPSGQNKLGPSPERAKLRSKTYHGIADAMANQWG